MTDEEAERLLARLSNLNSLRSIYDLIGDLSYCETSEPDALPFQISRLILQDFAWRVEGLGTNADDPLGRWAALTQELTPLISDVIRAYSRNDDTAFFNGLKRLTETWATLRDRLR